MYKLYKYKIFSIKEKPSATKIAYKTPCCIVFICKILDCKKLKCLEDSSINAIKI